MDYSAPALDLGDPLALLVNQTTYHDTALHMFSNSKPSPVQFMALYAMAPSSVRGSFHSPPNWPRVLHVAFAKLALDSGVVNYASQTPPHLLLSNTSTFPV